MNSFWVLCFCLVLLCLHTVMVVAKLHIKISKARHVRKRNVRDHKFWVPDKQDSLVLVYLLFHNLWLLCSLGAACVCALNPFSPCSAAPSPPFSFLHSQTTPAPPKYTSGPNKNIFSCVIAGQTSVSLLDLVFDPQQISSDKRTQWGLQTWDSKVLKVSYPLLWFCWLHLTNRVQLLDIK